MMLNLKIQSTHHAAVFIIIPVYMLGWVSWLVGFFVTGCFAGFILSIVLSELYKIALVHLYTQGYDGAALSNFELTLSTPSIIYEQEKVALWKEKVDLAKQMQDTKLLPSDFIYHSIFQFSEDQFDEYRDLVIQDTIRGFRLSQIENEGNDPAKSGKSYGTPLNICNSMFSYT